MSTSEINSVPGRWSLIPQLTGPWVFASTVDRTSTKVETPMRHRPGFVDEPDGGWSDHRNVLDQSTVQTMGIAADSAEEYVGKIPLPIFVGSLVDEEGHPPWATRFIVGVGADQYGRQSREIAAIDVALLEHPRQDEIACLVVDRPPCRSPWRRQGHTASQLHAGQAARQGMLRSKNWSVSIRSTPCVGPPACPTFPAREELPTPSCPPGRPRIEKPVRLPATAAPTRAARPSPGQNMPRWPARRARPQAKLSLLAPKTPP